MVASVCSEHFIGKKKSNHTWSPSYNPSIFPEIYKKCNSVQKEERYKWHLNRNFTITPIANEHIENPTVSEQFSDQPIIYQIDKSAQVAFDVDNTQDFEFSCSFDGNNCSTQVSIPYF